MFALFLSFLSFLIIYLFSDFISVKIFQKRLSKQFVKFLALCFPCISVSSVFNGYFTAVRKVSKSSAIQIIEEIIKIASTVILIEFFEPISIEGCCTYIIFGNIFGEFVSMILALILYIKSAYGFKNQNYSNDITSRILRIAVPVALSSYLKSALSSIKQIIIPKNTEKSGVSSKEALSAYGEISGMAVPVIMFPTSISGSVSTLVIPEISRCYAKRQFEMIKNIINRVYSAVVEFSVCSALVFAMYGIRLGQELYENTNVGIYITLMAPLVIIMYADTLTDSILKGIDCQNNVVKINIIDALLCIFLISIIIPRTGAVGYILILYISEVINIFLSINALRKRVKFSVTTYKLILIPLFAASVTAYISTYFNSGLTLSIIQSVCIYYLTSITFRKIFA